MNKIFSLFVICCFCFAAKAQFTIQPSQFLAACDFVQTTSELEVEWALGDVFTRETLLINKTEDSQPWMDDIRILGNPVSNNIVVELVSDEAMSLHYQLYSMWGEQVLRKSVSQNIEKIPVSDLPAGVYFLHFFTREGLLVGTFKIIKV